jgi:OOP family OmpA-OmpF porin
MMISKILYIQLLAIIFSFVSANSQVTYSDSCKVRLSNSINRFQPVLTPVLNLDGTILYFDRKSHPDNTGGISDSDEILFSNKLPDGTWAFPEQPGFPLNSKYSDVLFSLSPDGRTALVYGIQISSLEAKQPGLSKLLKTGNRWSKPIPLNIDKFYNNSPHIYANLSADGNALLLSLDRNEGQGQLDLYVSFRNRDTDTWSEPMNLGSDINTSGSEESPFLAYDNKSLYFSSDSLGGKGNLDLFVSRRLDDSWKNWSKPENLGAIINSEFDENGICLNALGDSAIIVSADTVTKRKGLYEVCLDSKHQPEAYRIYKGKVIDETGNTLKFPTDILIKVAGKYIYETSSTPMTGEYVLVLPKGKDYQLKVSLKGYEEYNSKLDLLAIQKREIINRDITLIKKAEPEPKTKLELTLFFDYNSSKIHAEELQKLVARMSELKRDSEYSIRISGHTDSVGSEGYNQRLSKRRAQSVAEAIEESILVKNKGIKFEKIKIEALGETQPRSQVDSENRRVEIFISEN